nr:hypothetical protein RVX_0762 [Nitratidesulfovibrio sp. HK-II]
MFLSLRQGGPQAKKSPRRARSHSARAAAALLFFALLALAAPTRAANSGGATFALPSMQFANPGYVGVYRPDASDATGGNVTIDTGITGPIIGGFSDAGNANGNSVTVTGGTHTGEGIYGGFSDGSGSASNNIVTITGGAISTMVFGGYSQAGTATGNTLRIFGTPDLRNSGLVGGRFHWDGMSALQDTRTGNTLEIHTLNLQTSGIDNFQHFRFYLPDTVRAGDTVLTVDNGVVIETPSSGPSTAPTTVGVGIVGGGTPLAVNDTVTLIKSTSFLFADTGMTNTTTGMAGISSLYTFGLETTVNSLLARVTSIEQTDESVRKSPSEGKAAGVALVTQGADLAAGPGMGNARAAAVLGADNMAQAGWAGFGATSGGTSRYATGSHVDVQSFSLMTGLAKRLPVSGTDLLVGAFFETSVGSYDSHNETAAGDSITARGDSRSNGGGLLGRVEATDGMARGLYAEATVRAGRLSSDYRSDDLNPTLGEAEYDINVAYYGAHAGVGYIWNISEQAWLDLYGKYLWTHTTGADVRILGDPVTFDDVDSYRTRLGARFGYALNKCITPYTGAAWEYEFDGTAHSVVAGVDAPAPTLKGGTGVGEAGIIWKPLPDSGFSLDLGAQGYTGVREGVGGNLSLMYEF